MVTRGRWSLVLCCCSLGCGARSSILELDPGAPGGGQTSGPSSFGGKAGATGGGGGSTKPPENMLPPQAAIKAIAAGGGHTCAILSSGLKCWGVNTFGVLGLEDMESRGDEPNEMGNKLPRVNLGKGELVSVAAGADTNTCALFTGGRVKCWGDNDFGQLGLGDFIDRGGYPGEMGEALPFVDLGDGSRVEQLVAGSNHVCAILSDASLKCWGHNANGQLGLGEVLLKGGVFGDMGNALPKVELHGARVTQVAAGSVQTCALLEGGGVKCWGWLRGFEDVPTMPDSPLTDMQLGGGLTALEVAAGGVHTCALLSDTTVRCWGVTEHALVPPQLLPPVSFGGGRTPRHLGVSGGRACALLSDASVECWQIDDAVSAPIQFTAGRRAVQMSIAGGRRRYHGCALLDDDSVECWGENEDGQLGVGDVTPRAGDSTSSLVPVDLGTK